MVNKNLIFGIIGILILGGGGALLLTQEQADASYTCTTNNVTGIFERFSSTNVTAYWTVNGTTKSAVCTKGKWIPTNQWLKNNNITLNDLTLQPLEDSAFDELGNPIIVNKTIIVDKSGNVSIKGEIYEVKYVDKPPIIRCICDKIGGCKIKECIQ